MACCRVREVQKNKSCSNNWRTTLKSWPTRSKNTTKNFRSKFGPEPSPHGHALFFRVFLQVKNEKCDFRPEPSGFRFSNRATQIQTVGKGFVYWWFQVDPTTPSAIFWPHPFLTGKNTKNAIFGQKLSDFDLQTVLLKYKP